MGHDVHPDPGIRPGARLTRPVLQAEARRTLAPGLARDRPEPTWATWEELAAAAMALGSGLIIQAAIDDDAVDPTLAGRVLERLLADLA